MNNFMVVPDILFLDTGYIVGLLNRKDPWHKTAASLFPLLKKVPHTITTEAILIETGNALASIDRVLAISFIESCYNTPSLEIIPVTSNLFQAGLDLYKKHQDKTWGMTDCISFSVMNELHILHAMTNDVHFTQAGFIAIMREHEVSNP